MKRLIFAAGILGAILPATAMAQSGADDVRCLIVSSTFARSTKNPQAEKVAQAASGFFLGRVDGRVPPAALRAMLVAQEKGLTQANAASTMNACVARMAAANRVIQALAPQGPARPANSPAGR